VIEAVWDDGFKRAYKKRVRNDSRLKRKFWERLDLFMMNPFSPQLRTHKLSGKLNGLWAFLVLMMIVESFLTFLGRSVFFLLMLGVMMKFIEYSNVSSTGRPLCLSSDPKAYFLALR